MVVPKDAISHASSSKSGCNKLNNLRNNKLKTAVNKHPTDKHIPSTSSIKQVLVKLICSIELICLDGCRHTKLGTLAFTAARILSEAPCPKQRSAQVSPGQPPFRRASGSLGGASTGNGVLCLGVFSSNGSTPTAS